MRPVSGKSSQSSRGQREKALKANSADLAPRLSLDSSVLLAYLLGEKLGERARTVLEDENRKIFLPHTALSEAYYVLCRKRGPKYADGVVSVFLDGDYGELLASTEIDMAAGKYKCERAISLADCYVLAAAKLRHATALFAKSESDLLEEMQKRTFDVEIDFL